MITRTRRARYIIILAGLLASTALVLVTGCRKAPTGPWEIVVQNDTANWCEVKVENDPGPGASIPDVAPRQRRVLETGSEKTTVRSVSVVANRQKHTLSPNAEVGPGQRCLIAIAADGQTQATVSNR
jgi:hypothetical protein